MATVESIASQQPHSRPPQGPDARRQPCSWPRQGPNPR
jgi:hypothetical protein